MFENKQFFKFLVGDPPQLGSWLDRRLELPNLLEDPSGNCQRTHTEFVTGHVDHFVKTQRNSTQSYSKATMLRLDTVATWNLPTHHHTQSF